MILYVSASSNKYTYFTLEGTPQVYSGFNGATSGYCFNTWFEDIIIENLIVSLYGTSAG
jgi:hypothetical protein